MISYQPNRPPKNSIDELAEYVYNELGRLGEQLQTPSLISLKRLNVAPTKPRDGYIAYADGTDWNPGAGAGIYGYYATTWNKF